MSGFDFNTDVTEEFFRSCHELALGDVVKYEGFDLADAMSAIEIMDPKMDMGMQPFDDELDLQSVVKNGKIDVTDVKLTDLIAVIDGTFTMVICWLNGQPLDQTVYTNICLLDIDKVKDPVLAGFCSATLNFLRGIKLCIELAGVFNEEDFSSFSCRVELKTDFHGTFDELDTAIEIVRAKKSEKDQVKLLEAVEGRLCLLQSIFDMFSHLLPSSSTTTPNFKKASFAVERALSWASLTAETIGLGTQPLANGSGDADFSWLPHFQPLVNRRVLPPSFPRTPKLMTRIDALKYLQKMLHTMKRMIFELPEKMRDIEGLMDFFKNFGGEDSCVLTRSFGQLLVMPDDYNICGLYPLSDIIYDSMKRLNSFLSGDNPALSLLNDPSLEECLKTFLTYCVRAFIAVFQAFGHNVARQRDKLLSNCFEDFGVLQFEAIEIEARRWENIRARTDGQNDQNDGHSRSPSVLSTFVLYHVIRLMHYHFELGFRLELFVPYEFTYIYWYMGEIVSNHLSSILERRCSLIVLNYSRSIAALETKKPNKKQQLKQRAETELRKNIGEMQENIFQLKVETYLCYAFMKFVAALQLSQRLSLPIDSDESMRYRQRFEVFSALSSLPTLLKVPYELYRNASGIERLMHEGTVESAFGEASAHFEEAASFLKSVQTQNSDALNAKMHQLIKTAKQNAIVAKLLSSSPNLKKKVVFEPAPADNPMFPLIKFV